MQKYPDSMSIAFMVLINFDMQNRLSAPNFWPAPSMACLVYNRQPTTSTGLPTRAVGCALAGYQLAAKILTRPDLPCPACTRVVSVDLRVSLTSGPLLSPEALL